MSNFIEQIQDLHTKWEDRTWPIGDSDYDNVLFTLKAVVHNHIPVHQILACYSTEKRRYHNVSHLWDMISLGVGFPCFCQDIRPTDLVIAIAGHDVVYEYDSVATENEVMSAIRTASFFELKPEEAHDIGHAIFSTAKHGEDLSSWANRLEKELLDRDLFSFSKEYEKFKQDSVNVVDEIFYAAGEACKPKNRDDIIKSQCAFYEHLLMTRATIYYRHSEWESQARNNLVRYVREARNGG